MEDECRWECRAGKGDNNKTRAQHTPKAALFMLRWRRAVKTRKSKNFWLLAERFNLHGQKQELFVLQRSLGCKSQFSPAWSQGTAWEREKIQAGQMVASKQLPTAAGSSKKIQGRAAKIQGRAAKTQPRPSVGQGKQSLECGQQKELGTSSVLTARPKKNELKNHLVGFSGSSALGLLENQQKLSARNCCALNLGLKSWLEKSSPRADLVQIHVWGRKNPVVVIKSIFSGGRDTRNQDKKSMAPWNLTAIIVKVEI